MRIKPNVITYLDIYYPNNFPYTININKTKPEIQEKILKEVRDMGLLWGLLLGAVAGFFASKLMNEKSGTLKNIFLGLGGGLVGGFVFKIIGLSASGLFGSLVVSTLGACICIWAGRKLLK